MKLLELLVACDNIKLSDKVAVYIPDKDPLLHNVDWWLAHSESYNFSVNAFCLREDGLCLVSAEE